MIKILKAHGIPDELVTAIETNDTKAKAEVLSPDGETVEYDTTAVNLERDKIAPHLTSL